MQEELRKYLETVREEDRKHVVDIMTAVLSCGVPLLKIRSVLKLAAEEKLSPDRVAKMLENRPLPTQRLEGDLGHIGSVINNMMRKMARSKSRTE